MALVLEAGSAEGCERWVREGTRLGHVVIHEIRLDGIVYHDGNRLREMAVEFDVGPASIVQDIRSGSHRVSAAAGDVGGVAASPAGPNDIAIGGN